MAVFDLHVHTTIGSSDSNLSPDQIIERAVALDIDGVCLTEHSGGWDSNNLQKHFPMNDLIVIGALEVATDMGHVLVFGMNSYVTGMNQITELRKIVDRVGGVMIAAHPFRNFFNTNNNVTNLVFQEMAGSTPSDVSIIDHPLFNIVDDIEVINGGNTDRENQFASEVSHQLNMSGLGGSDAHSLHGLGRYITTLNGDIKNESQLIECLRTKSFKAGKLLSRKHEGKSLEYNDSI